MSRATKKSAPAKRAVSERGTYVKRGRQQQAAARPSPREMRALDRDVRLAERGLLPEDRKASYAAMKPSEFRRVRTGLGGEADAHLANEVEFWRLRELSRSMDRDDLVPGPLVDNSLDLVLGTGTQMDPQTGFAELNAAIKDRWIAWATNPQACDVAGRFPLAVLERLALRHERFDGDDFTLVHRDGAQRGKVQLLEGDRVAGCDGPNGDVLHGVEVEPLTGAIKAVYVLNRRPAERKQTGYRAPKLTTKSVGPEATYTRVPAYTDGKPNVLQVVDPKRVTQTRGVTRWHRSLDILGQADDTLYGATQAQLVRACIPAFITTSGDVKIGKREEAGDDESGDDDVKAPPFEEMTPGTVPRLLNGEGIQGVSGGASPPDLPQHLSILWQLICMQIGLPYSLGFRDTTGRTFHGYRGELDMAKRAAKWIHVWFPGQWIKPIYDFRLDMIREELLAMDGPVALQVKQAEKQGTFRKVRVQPPAWPYVDPKTDVEADGMKVDGGQESPRQVLADRGRDIDDVRAEWIEDVAKWRKAAKEAAEAADEPEAWREYMPARLLQMPLPGGAGVPSAPAKPGEAPESAQTDAPKGTAKPDGNGKAVADAA